jgi:hypothetical protein
MTMLTLKKAADNEIKGCCCRYFITSKITPPGNRAAVVVGTTQRFGTDGLRWTTRRLFC